MKRILYISANSFLMQMNDLSLIKRSLRQWYTKNNTQVAFCYFKVTRELDIKWNTTFAVERREDKDRELV